MKLKQMFCNLKIRYLFLKVYFSYFVFKVKNLFKKQPNEVFIFSTISDRKKRNIELIAERNKITDWSPQKIGTIERRIPPPDVV